MIYSTYLSGSGDDVGRGIAVDSSGNTYVTGYTNSTDFPTMSPLQPRYGGGGFEGEDAFVSKLDPTGSALLYSTYLGGSGIDVGYGIAVDGSGDAFVTGHSLPGSPLLGGGNFVGMQGTHPSRADAPAALVMAALFLTFGVFAIWRPDKLRSAMDSFAGGRKEGSWHLYRMPLPLLRLVVGGSGIGGAALFVYIAYIALSR